jgi:hypothetical protein
MQRVHPAGASRGESRSLSIATVMQTPEAVAGFRMTGCEPLMPCQRGPIQSPKTCAADETVREGRSRPLRQH